MFADLLKKSLTRWAFLFSLMVVATICSADMQLNLQGFSVENDCFFPAKTDQNVALHKLSLSMSRIFEAKSLPEEQLTKMIQF